MEFKGTKGKWFLGDYCNIMSETVVERIKNHKDGIVKTEGGEIIQCWEDFHDGTIIPREECEANALLISKAPELLDFINRISGEMLRNDFVLDEKWWKQATQLIKEATEL